MRKKVLSLFVCLCMILSSMSFVSAADNAKEKSEMQKTIEILGEHFDGEEMFDYLSYVYMGWRTTGGRWQNKVIDDFIVGQLAKAGYTYKGAEKVAEGAKGSNDMSGNHKDDYSWVTYYDVDDLTWDPEYARLEITTDADFSGKKALVDRVNVESYAFNPTTKTYQEHYGKNIDEMYAWITKKDAAGKRVNVANGKEAELNDRCHLAWQTCFTDPMGTDPKDAKGVSGQVVYVGTVAKGEDGKYTCSEFKDAAQLQGKVLLSDSSLKDTFALAAQEDAVAVMSTASLSSYSVPLKKDGSIVPPFETSARYARGAGTAVTSARTATGKPIVEWQFSNDQKTALKELLKKAGDKAVYAKNVSVGGTYAMNAGSVRLADGSTIQPKGQAVAMAEIKGAAYPDERIIICAHVQEPGSNDNATGVGNMLGMATAFKKMIDEGKIARPERTITFLWGDEMNLATLWMESHPKEKAGVVAALDMDMTGENPEKTGGVMRIEKTPDPSAEFNYTLDTLPWEDAKAYDKTFADAEGKFVRLPDSHTLWGAGDTEGMFKDGFFLNDLYMAAAQGVIQHHDKDFKVDVCPYEGGSDHSRFLEQNVPALLTWHFTDYTYHTSVDTLAMSSGREMENVGITTMATALMMANSTDKNEAVALEVMKEVYDAAIARFDIEKKNTDNHKVYTAAHGGNYEAALADEKKVLNAWGSWYDQAIDSAAKYLLKKPSEEFKKQEAAYKGQLKEKLDQGIAYAEKTIKAGSDSAKIKDGVKNTKITITKTSSGKGWLKISWKRSKNYKVDYYEVFKKAGKSTKFGTKPSFKTAKGGTTASYKTKGLKKGTRYYFKVRGVRKIDGQKVYTKWSKTVNRIAQ